MSLNTLVAPKKLVKEGELMGERLSKVDFQKISFKNVTINFDYDRVGDFSEFKPSLLPSLINCDSKHLIDYEM